jgi:hypothetical protein
MAAKRGTDGGGLGGIVARGRRWWRRLDRGWQATILGLVAVGLSSVF